LIGKSGKVHADAAAVVMSEHPRLFQNYDYQKSVMQTKRRTSVLASERKYLTPLTVVTRDPSSAVINRNFNNFVCNEKVLMLLVLVSVSMSNRVC
jgi:hypothetical protein